MGMEEKRRNPKWKFFHLNKLMRYQETQNSLRRVEMKIPKMYANQFRGRLRCGRVARLVRTTYCPKRNMTLNHLKEKLIQKPMRIVSTG
ncbi:hypothetical protein GIB67_029739 [Kingdonia uniflora]|uniref:Uncharacterized protein n=1 Tax=Kingdonia uniflora TaxID=39325 RepID=A0A7J7LLZ8_9MAGN|nr:hypothetical protein GIB67_029739 [Kingdonia uniflora]